MNANLHTPERLDGESMKAYRERRLQSRRRGNALRFGVSVGMHFGHGRRTAVKAAGGIRQFKRARSAPLRAAKV